MDTLLDPRPMSRGPKAARADARARCVSPGADSNLRRDTETEMIGVLTIFAEFFIPLTFMVGTYGTASSTTPTQLSPTVLHLWV